MRAERFFDTNVLIYAFAAGSPKSEVAERLLAAGGATSVQVFNEFANVCHRKLGLTWRDVDGRIGALRALLGEPAPLTVAIHDAARGIARSAKINLYDALIVAAAQSAGAKLLVTEDL